MNVVELLYQQVKSNPNKIALVNNTKTITYAQLGECIQLTATYFKSKSITKGDRVLIAVPMSVDTYRVVLALLYIGAIPVFMEEWAIKNNFYANTKYIDCKAVVIAKQFKILAIFSKAIRSIPIKLNVSKQGNLSTEIIQLNKTDSALLSFTSGSSGKPKIADRSHGFLLEQFKVLKEVTNCNGNEVVCVGLAVVVLFYLAQGNTVVLRTSNLIKHTKILNQLILKYGVTQIIDSPAKLVTYSHFLQPKQTQQITHTFCGGGPVFEQEAKQLNAIFTNSINTVIYGSTEAEPISTIITTDIIKFNKQKSSGLCVGKVNPNLALKFLNLNQKHIHQPLLTEFNNMCVSENAIGEIIVSGNHVLKTYFKSNDVFKKQKIIVNDTIWHKTGDCGYLKDGNLFLVGQCNSIIRHNGKLIFPFIVEQELRKIKGIKKGTILKIDSKITVIIESDLPLEKLKIDLPFEFNRMKKVTEIPMDVRHNTKIDYARLKKNRFS